MPDQRWRECGRLGTRTRCCLGRSGSQRSRVGKLASGNQSGSDLSRIKAIAFDFDGVFTDNRVYVMQNGEEAVLCDRSDGMGVSMLRKAGVPMVIISTEKNPVVAARGAKIQIEVLQDIEDKLPTLDKWANDQGLTLADIAFVGNDINDVECLSGAGLGVVVADAYPVAVEAADPDREVPVPGPHDPLVGEDPDCLAWLERFLRDDADPATVGVT